MSAQLRQLGLPGEFVILKLTRPIHPIIHPDTPQPRDLGMQEKALLAHTGPVVMYPYSLPSPLRITNFPAASAELSFRIMFQDVISLTKRKNEGKVLRSFYFPCIYFPTTCSEIIAVNRQKKNFHAKTSTKRFAAYR